MNKTFKKYLISSLITFSVAFAIAILPDLDSLTKANFTVDVLFGLLFTGARAGVKAIVEGIAAYKAK